MAKEQEKVKPKYKYRGREDFPSNPPHKGNKKMTMLERFEYLDLYLTQKKIENFREMLDEVLTMETIPEAARQAVVYEILRKHGYI